MVVKVSELIRQDVGIWAKVKCILSKPFLETHDIEAESVLSRDFIALWEVIDLLILVQALILVALARAGAPENVPFVGVCGREAVLLQYRPTKLIIKSDHLIEQL